MTAGMTVQAQLWTVITDILFYHGSPWELDDALLASGLFCPPCLTMDQNGLDGVAAIVTTATAKSVLSRMVAEGRLGRKTSWGFYRYTQSGGALADPLIEDLIREETYFAGQTRDELDEAGLVAKTKAACRTIEARGSDGADERSEILVALLGCKGPDWWRR